jgi:replication factor A2
LSVSVKQLLQAQSVEDQYRVDEVELNTIRLVGSLMFPQEHSTNFTFKLNDGSGSIDCKQWIEKDGAIHQKVQQLRYLLIVFDFDETIFNGLTSFLLFFLNYFIFYHHYREGNLVRVIGNMRNYEGSMHILVYDVSLVEDWNELSYHMLDVIFTHLQNTKGKIPVSTLIY